MRPSGIINNFEFHELEVSDIEKTTQDLLDDLRVAYDKIASLEPDEINYESCIQVYLLIVFYKENLLENAQF